MEIGAFIQCYKQPLALDIALFHFRKAYPTGTIVLVSDNGYNYSKMAEKYNCLYFHGTMNTRVDWYDYEPEKYAEFFNRLRNYIPLIKEDYFMILEEDVIVMNRITEPFLGTLNGNPLNLIKKETIQKFRELQTYPTDFAYTGQGGSVWEKKHFLKMINDDELLTNIANQWNTTELGNNKVFDNFSSVVCVASGGTIHKMKTIRDIIHNMHDLQGGVVFHQVKQFYRNEVFPEGSIF
jgi:hypothetical protein